MSCQLKRNRPNEIFLSHLTDLLVQFLSYKGTGMEAYSSKCTHREYRVRPQDRVQVQDRVKVDHIYEHIYIYCIYWKQIDK